LLYYIVAGTGCEKAYAVLGLASSSQLCVAVTHVHSRQPNLTVTHLR
jgi:hypothetical protein